MTFAATSSEFRVNTALASDQVRPSIVRLTNPDGSFAGTLVAWSTHENGNWDIKLQRYDAAGSAVGEQVTVNTVTAGYQAEVYVTVLANGCYVVAFNGDDNWGYGVYAQAYAPDGTGIGGNILVTPASGSYQYDARPGEIAGGFIITYTDDRTDGDGEGIYGQRFSLTQTGPGSSAADYTLALAQPNGTVTDGLSAQFKVSATSVGTQRLSETMALADGGTLIFHQSPDSNQSGVFATRMNADGTLGTQIQISSELGGYQGRPEAVQLNNGNVMVVYTSADQDGSSYGVYGRILDTSGNPLTTEFRVNSSTHDYQSWDNTNEGPQITKLADGSVVVAWNAPDAWAGGIYARHFDAAGNPDGREFLLNEVTYGYQFAVDIVATTGSDFTAVWQSTVFDGNGYDVKARSFSISGAVFSPPADAVTRVGGEDQVPTGATYRQENSQIVRLPDGGYVIAWASETELGTGDGSNWGLFAQRYDAAGNRVGSEFQLNENPLGEQYYYGIAATASGGLVVTWHTYQTPGDDGNDVWARTFDSTMTGAAAFRVNTYLPGEHAYPDVAVLSDGGFVVTYRTYYEGGTSYNIWAQRYNADGTANGARLAVSEANGANADDNSEHQGRLVELDGGRFAVIFEDNSGQDGSGNGLFGRVYEADGTAGTTFRVTQHSDSEQGNMGMAKLPGGGFVVTWISLYQDGDGWGVYARVFDANGAPVTNEFRVAENAAGYQGDPRVAVLTDGSLMFAYSSGHGDGFGGDDVYAIRFTQAGVQIGNEFRVNVQQAGGQERLSDIAATDDGFVISWINADGGSGTSDGSEAGVFKQQFRVDGIGSAGGDEQASAPTLTVAAAQGVEDSAIALSIAVALNDANSGTPQTLRLEIGNIPVGATIADGTGRSFTATIHDDAVDISGWALAGLTVTPAANRDTDFALEVRATATEAGPSGRFDQVTSVASLAVDVVPQIERIGTGDPSARVNTYGNADQTEQHIAIDPAGNRVIVWQSNGADGSSQAVQMQRYAPDGTPIGAEVTLNTVTAGFQGSPEVTFLTDGKFVVVWRDDGSGQYTIHTQVFDADGTRAGAEQTIHPNNVYWGGLEPAVTALTGGGFVVAFHSLSNSIGTDGATGSWGVYAQRFDASGGKVARDGGTPGEQVFQLNTTIAGDQTVPALTGLANGGFMAVWKGYNQPGDQNEGLYGQVFDATGTPVGDEFHVNISTDGRQDEPHLVTLANGNVVVTWSSDSAVDSDPSDYGAFARVIAPDGTALTGELRLNSYTEGSQGFASVTALPGGGFVAVWHSNGEDGHGWGVISQRFSNDGDAIGQPWRMSSSGDNNQLYPDIAYDAHNNSVVAVWQDDGHQGDLNNWGIVSRAYALPAVNGQATGGLVTVPTAIAHAQQAPSTATFADGSYIVVWQTQPAAGAGDASSWSVRAQKFNADGSRMGGEFAVNINVLGDQSQPEVVALDGGGYVVVWHSQTGDAGGGYGIFAQMFAADGTRMGGEMQISQPGGGDQIWPDVTALHGAQAGGFAVAWEWSDNIWARAFDAAGDPLGNEIQVSGQVERITNGDSTENRARIASGPDGGFVVVFQDHGGDKNSWAVIGQRYEIVAGVLTAVGGTNADGTAAANNFRVNSAFYGEQAHGNVAYLADGRFVVVWESQAPGQYGLYGQFYNADGTLSGREFQVDANLPALQHTPDIAALPNGGFLVSFSNYAYDGSGDNVNVLHLDAQGRVVETFINPLPRSQGEGVIAVQGNGFNLVFGSDDGRDGWGSPGTAEGNGVFLQHYALDFGASAGRKVAQTPTLTAPATASGDEDTAIAVPLSAALADSDGGSETLSVKIVGLPVGTRLSDGAGNSFVATAQNTAADVTGWTLSGLTVTPPADFNGTLTLQVEAIATEARTGPTDTAPQDIAINTATVRVTVAPVDETLPPFGAERLNNSSLGNSQYEPGVASQTDGTYLVVWRSDYQYQDGQGGPYHQVMGQLHAADGSKVGGEFSITRYTGQDAWDPEARALSDGTYLVSYTGYGEVSSSGVWAQRVTASGTLLTAEGTTGTAGRVLMNTHTDHEQSDSEIAPLADGGWIATWRSVYQDGSNWGIYAQRFNADGTKNGGELHVNADDPQVGDPLSGGLAVRDNQSGDQLHPAVAQLAGGGFLFTWYSPDNNGDGIVGRIVGADGTFGRVFAISGTQPFDQESPQVIALANGRAVVVWNSWHEDGSNWGIYAQLVNADGTLQGTQFRVSSYGYDSQQEPTLTALPDGGFIVTWTSHAQDGDSWGVYGQRYDAGAIPVGTEFRINTTVPGDQSTPAVAVQGDGSGVIVAFEGQDGSGYGTYDLRLPLPDATSPQDIARLGQESRVNPTESAGAQWDQAEPIVAKLVDGSFVVIYQSNGQDGSSWGVYARHYTAGGDAIAWNVAGNPLEMRVNETTSSDQSAASVVALPGGGFVVAWQSYNGGSTGWDIMARRYNADGTDNPLKDAAGLDRIELNVNAASGNFADQHPDLTVNADGSLVVAWHSDRIGQSWDVFTRAIDATGQLAAGADTQINVITGGEQRNVQLTSLSNGTVVAVWHSYNHDGDNWGIYGRLLDAAGQPLAGSSDFLINAYTDSEQSWPKISELQGGGFVVVWQTYTNFDTDGSSYGIAAQRFDNAGNTLGSEILVNGIARDAQIIPDVIGTQDGGFVVAWESDNADGSSRAVELRRFDASGAPLDPYGNDVQANIGVTEGYQGQVALALLERGFVATWMSRDLDYGTSQSDNIRMQRFAGAGLEPPPYVVDPARGGDSASDLIFTTIQEALDAAPTGRTVLIVGGTYNEALTLGTDDLKIVNAPGETVVVTSPDTAKPALFVASGVSITIEGDNAANLQFVSAATGGASEGLAIELAGNNDQTVLNKITVTGSGAGVRFGTGQTGLQITNSVFNGPDNLTIAGPDGSDLTTDVQVLRNTFNTAGGSAIDSSGQAGKISLNVFAGTVGLAADEASLVLRGTGVDVNSNNFQGGSGPHIRPIAGTYAQSTLIGQNNFPEGYATVSSNNAVYATVAQALADAVAGDTIRISGGTWTEGTLTVSDQNLTIDAPGGLQGATGLAFQLADGVSALTLTGGANIDVTGNGTANVIVGNDGHNDIAGGGGTDTVTVSLSSGGVDTVDAGGDDDDKVILNTGALGGATISLSESGGSVTAASGGATRSTVSGAETVVVNLANSGDIDIAGFTPTPSGLNSITAEIFGDGGHNAVNATDATGFVIVHSSAGNDHYTGGAQAILTLDYTGNGGSRDVAIILSSEGATGITLNGTGPYDIAGNRAIDEWGQTDEVYVSNVTHIRTGAGNDYVKGGVEADYIDTGAGDDVAYGGGGNDVFFGNLLGIKNFYGGTGDDDYTVANGTTNVVESVGEGYDRVFTSLASYTLPANVEFLQGTSATGQTLIGNALANVIVTGGAGNDTVDAGDGNDTIVASLGTDSYTGGSGSDTVDLSAIAGPVTADLAAGTVTGTSIASTLVGIENLVGTAGADTLRGDGGANALTGGDGNDRLFGRGGNDALTGGPGGDTALYLVSAADGRLQRDGAGGYTFNAGSAEGTDTLVGIETIRLAGADGLFDTADDRVFAIINGNVAIQVAADTRTATEAGGLANAVAAVNATGNVLTNDINLDQDSGAGDTERVTLIAWTGATGPGTGSGTTANTAVSTGGVTILGRYGSLTISASGAYTYSPDAAKADLLPQGSSATETFSYTADDGSGNPAVTTLTITLNGANDTPVANAATATGGENAASIGGTLSASDADQGASLSYALVAGSVKIDGTAVSDATVTVNANGTYSYVPGAADDALNAGEARSVTFNFTASDGIATSPAQTATITVNGANDAPTAVSDSATTSENSAIDVNVLANDTDPDTTHVFTLVSATAPAGKGTASVSANQLHWEPGTAFDHLAVGASESVTIDYTMRDDNGATSSATATLTVTGVNDAPAPVANTVAVNEDATASASTRATGVLGNDTDIDDGETATLTVSGAHFGTAADTAVASTGTTSIEGTYGTLAISADGTYSYSPNKAAAQALSQNQSASDVFSYTVRDVQGATAASTLTFNISGQNDAPVANADSVTVNEDSGATTLTTSLLANDTDVDSTVLTITAAGAAANGMVSLSGGVLTYAPDANFNGTDSFTYTITDDFGGTATATVTVTVNAVNDPVTTTAPTTLSLLEDATGVAVTGLSIADPDTALAPGGVYVASLSATNGTLTLSATTGLTFSAGDGTADSAMTFSGTLAAINAALGTARYTPVANYHGAAQIVLQATDSFGGVVATGSGVATSDSDTVAVTITSVNDAPAGTTATITATEDLPRVLRAADFGFTDPDGNAFAGVVVTTLPASGTLALSGTPVSAGAFVTAANIAAGNLTFTAAPDANGPASASFTFRVRDNGGTANGGVNTDPSANTLTIDVTAVNDAPTVAIASFATPGTEQVAFDLKGHITVGDIDAGASAITVTLAVDYGVIEVTAGTSGAAIVSGNGTGSVVISGTLAQVAALLDGDATSTVTFTANTDAPPASATLTVTANDNGNTGSGGAKTGNATATIAITPVNDAPVAQPDDLSAVENAVATGSLFADNGSGADADPDGGPVTVSAVNGSGANVGAQITLASGALLTVNADGTYSYDPNGKFDHLAPAGSGASNVTATETFTYTLENGNTVTATVTIDGVAGPGTTTYMGSVGSDTITGGPTGDLFILSQGDDDTAYGLGGDDGFYFGAALTAADNVDGGDGTNDQVGLQGNYAGLTLGAGNLVNVEQLVLVTGSDTRFGDTANNLYSYNLTTIDANVPAGQTLTVNWNTLRAGEDVTFNGAAETDGAFLTYGGLGIDIITGGAQMDGFYFGAARWGASDRVDGRGGADQLGLQGDYTVTFGADQLTSIETIVLLSGADTRFGNYSSTFDYALTMNDGNVAAGARMTINANNLRSGETLSLNGSAETDGAFTVYSGAGADTVVGSAGADVIYGGAGADNLTGGAGNDTFAYVSAAHSTSAARDQILDFSTGDIIDLSGIDANNTVAGNDAFAFIGSAAFTNTAGELRAELVDNLTGTWLIQGDTNGDGVSDFEVTIVVTDSHPLTGADFVL